MPLYALGFMGMTRRLSQQIDPQFHTMLMIAASGAVLIVFLLKLTPGMSPALIPEIFHLYDCVIVESFGVGGIPQQLMDAFAAGLGDYETTHKVLIMTTQVTYEGSDVGVYEVGKRVKNRFRFLEAHDL